MEADDSRHGTTRGYAAGCRQGCCKRAMMHYEKRRDLHLLRTGAGLSMPALGAARRIEALQAIGWSSDAIAAKCGWNHRNYVNQIRSRKWLERKTYNQISQVFDELCMTPGPSVVTRQRATRAGYLPPLAWDDIDNDNEPIVVEKYVRGVDEVLVDRVIAGDLDAAAGATKPERDLIVHAYRKTGKNLAELERATGWAAHRYGLTA